MAFAEGTSVPVGRTRAEIETLVAKYGATRFAFGWIDDNQAAINFVAHGRLVRFVLPLPTKEEITATLKKTAKYQWQTPAQSTVDNAHGGARPFHLAWGRSIIEQCKAAETPVFFKQMGSRPFTECEGVSYPVPLQFKDRKGGDWNEFPDVLRVREFPR